MMDEESQTHIHTRKGLYTERKKQWQMNIKIDGSHRLHLHLYIHSP